MPRDTMRSHWETPWDLSITLQSRSVLLCSCFFLMLSPLGRLHEKFMGGIRCAAMEETITDHNRECTDYSGSGNANRPRRGKARVDDVVAGTLFEQVGTHERAVAFFKSFFYRPRFDLYLIFTRACE